MAGDATGQRSNAVRTPDFYDPDRKSRKLSLRHRVCVNAYLSGMTQRGAMDEAGFSQKSNPASVFGREDVRHEIARKQEELAAKFEISPEWVTRQLIDIATAGTVLAKFKKVDEDGLLSWDFTGATQTELALIETLAVDTETVVTGPPTRETRKTKTKMKVSAPSRQTALDALCRIHGYNKDTLEVKGALSLVDRLQRGRQRASLPGDDARDVTPEEEGL